MKFGSSMRSWIEERLKRKLTLALVLGLLFASLCFLAIIVVSYRNRVLEERGFASIEINRLLQVSLENAMLKRDLDGLRDIVERLGRQDKVTSVMILAPNGEVRFASRRGTVGRRYDIETGMLCPGCRRIGTGRATMFGFVDSSETGAVLRSVNAVANRDPCTKCHGPVATSPVNGLLIVDYDGTQLARDMWMATLALSGAGLVTLLMAIGGIGFILQRSVLAPVERLTRAARALSFGPAHERLPIEGRDEIARLGQAFNDMAARIAQSVKDVEERERRLQTVIDAIPDGVRVIDQDYKVVKVNAAFLKQHGRPIESVIDRPCYASSHARTEPCAATLVTCPLHEIRSGRGPLTCVHRHVRADGGEFNVEVSAAPFTIDADGQSQLLTVEVIRDLSQDLRLSQEQRLAEIGYLAAGVAHEIHNPLASIHLGLESINRELADGRVEKANQYIRVIDQQIGRCIEVTSRLLRLSAAPSDVPDLVVLNEVVFDVLSLLSAEAIASNVTVEQEMAENLRVIASDSEMRMMVLNIAQNAVHAMPDGGQLTVRGIRQGDMLEITIEDTGVGIAPDDLARIFDPFWSRRADGVHGTGLGLPICREILKRAGGQIAVSSEIGKGTRFIITLPSADRQVHAS